MSPLDFDIKFGKFHQTMIFDGQAYQIHTSSQSQFKRVMEMLFYRGHVFTSHRCKSFKEMEKHWSSEKWWYYIVVGDNDECKMVLNAGMSRSPYSSIPVVSFETFTGQNYK